MDSKKVASSLEEIPVVKDFLEVFLKELNRLPPHCEVEFMNELEVNTAPISKVPHQMVPGDLNELKV